jgi:protein involved in polysaccharide export with SLBB domain
MFQVSWGLKHVSIVLGLTAVMMGCAAKGGPVAVIPLIPPASQSQYIVQAGDTLDIKFYYHPDHDQRDVVVRLDGKLLLPLAGEIQAAGLMPEQLAEQIAQRYAANLRDPQVSLNIKTVNTGQVYVGGEVQRPGVVKLKPKMNALQAIFEAGGPRDEADVERVVLLRSIGENQFGYREINLKKILTHEDPSDDAALAQDDLIFIPKTGIAKANLWVEQYLRNMMPFGNPFLPLPSPINRF